MVCQVLSKTQTFCWASSWDLIKIFSLIHCGLAAKGRVLKNVDLSTFASETPTHPPNVEKQKKTCCFLGILAHMEQKKIWSFCTLKPTTATHWSHQLPPLITTTNYWRTPLPSTMVSSTVADAGGGWHQWWLAVVGGSSQCLNEYSNIFLRILIFVFKSW